MIGSVHRQGVTTLGPIPDQLTNPVTPMSSHTPGPWASCLLTVCGVPATFHVTASPKGSTDPICFSPALSSRKAIEIAANGRMIAAAPELLDAILNAVACAGHSTGTRQELADQIIEILAPVVAKVEGR